VKPPYQRGDPLSLSTQPALGKPFKERVTVTVIDSGEASMEPPPSVPLKVGL
jgi:hypothetical protein